MRICRIMILVCFVFAVPCIPRGHAETLPPHQRINTLSADAANAELIAAGRATPDTLPFLSGSQVITLRTTGEGYYVRYYQRDPSRFEDGAVGSWLMPVTEVVDKSVPTVADIFALPQLPDHIVAVCVPAGSTLRSGTAGPIAAWGQGGGQQILLMHYIAVDEYQPRLPLPATVNTAPLAERARSGNARAIATALDRRDWDDPFAYAQLARLSLGYTNDHDLDTTLDRLGPQNYDAINQVGVDQGLLFARTLLGHDIRTTAENPWNVWTALTAEHSSRDDWAAHDDLTTVSGGVLGGLDYQLSPRWSVGVGLGYVHSDFDLSPDLGEGKSDSLNLGLHSLLRHGPAHVALHASGALVRSSMERHIAFGLVDRVARGEADGHRWAVGAEAGWAFPLRSWTLTTFAGLTHFWNAYEDFSETHTDGLGLRVNGQHARVLVPALGLRAHTGGELSNGSQWSLDTDIAYAPRIRLDEHHINAAFIGGSETFSISSDAQTTHSIQPGLRLKLTHAQDLSMSLGYQGQFAHDFQASSVDLALEMGF